MSAQDSLTSNPRENKRGACDRCRGQKLRCLREDQSQDSTCVRCFKAGAVCSFGVPKRAGRPRGSSSFTPQERKGNRGGNAKQGGMLARPAAHTNGPGVFFESKADGGLHRSESGGWDDSSFLRENTAEEESGGETEDTAPAHAMSPMSLFDNSNILGGADVEFPTGAGFSTATLPWQVEALPQFYTDNAGETPDLAPFGAKYSWAFHPYHAGPMDMPMLNVSPASNDGQTREVGVTAYATTGPSRSANVQPCQPPDDSMDIDQPMKVPNGRHSRARDRNKDRPRSSASFSVNSTATLSRLKDAAECEAGGSVNDDNVSVKEGQHRRMQELSELAMDLYAQLAANDPENHPPASAALATASRNQLIGTVLKTSNTFLTLLTSFSAAAPPPLLSTSPDASACSPSLSGGSPPASALDDEDESGTDDAMPSPPTDMTTVLQLLTCYIRVVRLHSIMYTSILDYTLAFPAAASPRVAVIPPVFPGLQIGGVSLDGFGTLQVVLLLQIAVQVLGEIEVTLGLPEEYRVGRCKGGGRGVLEASVSSSFVKCLMREGVWRGKQVECIREQLTQLERVLKGAKDS
ncbi:hypothetical protein MMC17_009304 [Xylographa soralifera]|nr:hypothetical protein [Xylographa soralifera]